MTQVNDDQQPAITNPVSDQNSINTPIQTPEHQQPADDKDEKPTDGILKASEHAYLRSSVEELTDIKLEEFENVDLATVTATILPSTTQITAEPSQHAIDTADNKLVFDDDAVNDETTLPPPHANILSKMFFGYVTPVVRTGHSKTLGINDMFGLPKKENTTFVHEEFAKKMHQCQNDGKSQKYLLMRTSFALYGKPWLAAVILYGISQLLMITNPLLMQVLINFVQDKNYNTTYGYLAGVGLVIFPFMAAFCSNHCVVIAMRVAQRIRIALNMAVYEKALRLSNGKEGGASLGEIVDILNNDTNRILNSFHEIIFGLIAPIQIVAITVILYIRISYFAFVSIGAIIILILPNALIAKKMHLARKRMLHHTDERLRAVGELVNGIRSIKCYVWETFFHRKVVHAREQELVEIRNFGYLKATLYFLMGVLPSLAALATFIAYVLAGNNFTASKAYVTLALLNAIRFPLAYIPVAILNISANLVAFQRIQQFLTQAEAKAPEGGAQVDQKVVIRDGVFNWVPNTTPASLANINLSIPTRQFMVMVGSVGSGKSTLLEAILGEVPREAGQLEVNGSIAYVPQQAWIVNATLKDNILMGAPYDEARFRAVTAACALDADIEMLGGGVHTQIGEKGINISGGQQQRVSIARAAYSKKDILLLDDCLSAVDHKVADHIFNNCIKGFMADRTVVLVTNNLEFLYYADHVVILKAGEIAAQFVPRDISPQEIVSQLEAFGVTSMGQQEQEQRKQENQRREEVVRNQSEATLVHNPSQRTVTLLPTAEATAQRDNPATLAVMPPESTEPPRRFSQVKPNTAILVRDEERMTGSIPWSIYTTYLHAGGLALFLFVIVFFCVALTSHAAGDYWLVLWTTNRLGFSDDHIYLAIYAGFGGLELILQSVASFSMVGFGIKAAKGLHERMLNSMTNTVIQFFDQNPLGRIINRFSRDQDMLDVGLTERIYQFFAAFVLVLLTVVILGLVSFWIAVAIVPLGLFYFFLQKYYRKSSIELKRLEAVVKSPLLAQMVETLNGLSSIRAFSLQEKLLKNFRRKVDEMNSASYTLMLATQWLMLYLDMLGVLVMLATVIVIIVLRDSINYGLVGLGIVYATSLRFGLTFSVLASTQTEMAMNGTERVLEYTQLPQEPAPPANPTPLPPVWPSHGRIEFLDVDVKYRPELPPVLHGINCVIEPGQKIGIVGRTGAGKSTLATTLFRMVNTSSGMVLIDGVGINDIDVHDLRKNLTILPQIPMLFMGTVRENLDPYGDHTDAELWAALQVVQMADIISLMSLKLDSVVIEDGNNFSQGQKQLICLARALLKRSKVLLLDEAMAHVDFKTESIIQEAIATHLADATVLTIAHRIASILHSDKVMVLDKGRLLEFDSPQNLLANPNSLFHRMVHLEQQGESVM